MKTQFWLSFLTLIGLVSGTQIAQAQTYQPTNRTPVGDSTLDTQVLSNGNNFDITGGLRKGQNLFHSFTDFSVPENGAANFLNPAGNQSIITRVTGNLFSDINGLINTNGANFLLINPNGVVFGTNARLNVGQTFVTSTASGIDFVDATGRNVAFGVNQAGDIPLLTIDPNVAFNPARLIMNVNIPGSKGIENYGTLETKNPGQYIGLIGGNVSFNGGQIIAPGAKIEVGGLAQSGTIGFSLDNGAQFPKNIDRANVSLISRGTSPSLINVESSGEGSVGIFAKDITLQGTGTRIRAGIAAGLGSPTAIAGDINLEAAGNITLSEADIFNRVNTRAEGKSGAIKIVTRNLAITNGTELSTSTYGKGDAGNINITATENISFDGVKDGSSSQALSAVQPGAEGKAGGIEITTRNLSITNGAALAANTYGKGDAGDINITATDNVSLDGRKDGLSSAAESTVGIGAEGKSGAIKIVTGNLSVTNSAQLQAVTRAKGDAGTINIIATGNVSFDGGRDNFRSLVASTVEKGAEGKAGGIEIVTGNLSVTNGAQLLAVTKGRGDAGNIKITATGNIFFDGGVGNFRSVLASALAPGAEGKGGGIEIVTGNLSVTNGAQLQASTQGKGDAGKIKITATGNVSFDVRGIAYSIVAPGAEGKGGGVEIIARNLSVTNGAQLAVSTEGKGDAGDIFLKSGIITLRNGEILSQSASSNGGNINIASTDYLLLRNDSLIATDSDSTGKNGNGGNITINSPLIVATPGNNDITANAYNGTGGKVNIDSQGLFGIKYRLKGSDFTNDITVSSTFGQNGTVNIDTPGTDPGRDSTELPNATTDASNQISQVCSASNRQNKLTVTGRGGLPPNANDPLTSDVVWQDARAASPQPVASSATTNPAKLIPPAVGWVFDGKGKVTLVAASTQGQPTGTSVVCPSNK